MKNSGFTLIELLVVIAIIGILASIVMFSMNIARNKARDSVIKASISQVGKIAEMSREDNGDFDSVCAEAELTGGITTSVSNNGGMIVCNDNANEYCVSSILNNGTYICVDNLALIKIKTNGGCGTGTFCP